MKQILLLAIVGLLLAACTSGSSADIGQAAELDGTVWILETVNGNAAVPGSTLTVGFHNGEDVSVQGDCDSMGGLYTRAGDQLTINETGRTNFNCEDGDRVAQDAAVFAALGEAARYGVTGQTLTIVDQGNAVLLTLTRKQAPPLDPALADREWVLENINGQPPIEGTRITATFMQGDPDGVVTGTAGCNGYGGPYQVATDGKLSLSEMGMNAALCGEPDGVMEQESTFIDLLTGAAAYTVTGDVLEISDDGGQVVLTFRARPTSDVGAADLTGTSWQLVSIDGVPPISEEPVTLIFGDGTISGYAGCRDYEGEVIIDGDKLVVPSLGMTSEVCNDEEDLHWEGDFTTHISEMSFFTLVGGQLTITTRQGNELIFEPLP